MDKNYVKKFIKNVHLELIKTYLINFRLILVIYIPKFVIPIEISLIDAGK